MIPVAVWRRVLEEGEHLLKGPYWPRYLEPALKEELTRPWVTVIKGPRRAGKTTLALRVAADYDAAYVNFEHQLLYNVEPQDLAKLYELVKDREVVILDEVQHVKGWERLARRLMEQGRKVIATGSSSYLFSPRYGATLTGRKREFFLYPFTYQEVRTLKGWDVERYLSWGGFPQVVIEEVRELAFQYREDILLRDLAPFLRKWGDFKAFYHYVLDHPGLYGSRKRLSHLFDLSAPTIRRYISLMEDVFVILSAKRWGERVKGIKKLYPIDNGLSGSEERGRLLESLVAQALAREGYSLHYWKHRVEVDFVLPNMAIQVVYELNRGNVERELRPLKAFPKGLVVALYGWDVAYDWPKHVEVVDAHSFLLEPNTFLRSKMET